MVELSYTDFLNTDLGRWLDERLQANQADVVHDLLAYLTEQMIAMNKEKLRRWFCALCASSRLKSSFLSSRLALGVLGNLGG